MLQFSILMRKDALMESSKHRLRETPFLILQVVDSFQTQYDTTIVEDQDANIQLESHANNQIFHQILVFLIRCLCSSSFCASSIQSSFLNKLDKYWIMAHFVSKYSILAGRHQLKQMLQSLCDILLLINWNIFKFQRWS